MSHHALLTENEDLPDGYDTYSLLLIPDWKWIHKAGEDRYYDLFKHFKMFGDAIGPRHLAAWLYNAQWGSYQKLVDLEAYSVIYGSVASRADADKLGLGNKFDPARHIESGYDVIRAKYFCARCGLDFNSGPYIAFFEKKPCIPIVLHGFRHPNGELPKEDPTKPAFLIQFAGMSYKNVLSLLNDMEYQLIRDDLDTRKLQMGQLSLRIEHVCVKVGRVIGKTLRFIKDVKDIVPLPSPENIVKYD